jgi:glycerol kinase
VYLVPAFAGLGTPHWDGFARGALVGMTRGTTRATSPGPRWRPLRCSRRMCSARCPRIPGIALRELRVDGGASRNDLLMQMQADFLGVPVVRPQVTETTALGAAYLAGLATGFWAGADELAAQWARERQFEPQLSEDARQAKRRRWPRRCSARGTGRCTDGVRCCRRAADPARGR